MDINKRVKVHKLCVAGEGRHGSDVGHRGRRRVLAARGAVKVVKLSLDRVGGVGKLEGRAGGESCSRWGGFGSAMIGGGGDDFLALVEGL